MFSKEQLKAMTVEDLKIVARDLAVPNYSTMVKDDLITAIIAIQTPEKAAKLNKKNKPEVVADTDGKIASNLSGDERDYRIQENIRRTMKSKIDYINQAPALDASIYDVPLIEE